MLNDYAWLLVIFAGVLTKGRWLVDFAPIDLPDLPQLKAREVK